MTISGSGKMAELLCRAGDPQWLELRRTGVTATDIVTLAGLSAYDSPWALFWRKKGVLPEVEQTDRMRLGTWLEQAVVGHWMDQGNISALSVAGCLYANDDRPWQMATPDRFTERHEPLECKSWATFDGWGPDGTDQVPPSIRAQVLWQMDVLGVARGHVAVVFLPSGEFRSYTIEHGPVCDEGDERKGSCAACIDLHRLRALGLEFYRRLEGVLPPPDVDGHAATTAGLKARYAAPGANLRAELAPALLTDWEAARDELSAARAGLKEYERAAHEAENRVREALADACVGLVDGRPVIERRFTKRAGYTVEPAELDQIKRIKEVAGE